MRIADVMDPDPPVVGPGVDQEVAAWNMVNRGESSISVVDAAGLFIGLIPPHRMLSVLLTEHDEDLARLGGLPASCSIATILAMALPWTFQRFGSDPAFGSGPLATVVQDLVSIAVYPAIAT